MSVFCFLGIGSFLLPLPMPRNTPFDILYFTPSITAIANMNDKSFSLSPELLYTGITNLELRLKASFLSGQLLSEYGKKQNDYRVEARYGIIFDLLIFAYYSGRHKNIDTKTG